jgi:hypothetical protein
MGFEPTIPVFEQAKTFHASGRAAIVIGSQRISEIYLNRFFLNPHVPVVNEIDKCCEY